MKRDNLALEADHQKSSQTETRIPHPFNEKSKGGLDEPLSRVLFELWVVGKGLAVGMALFIAIRPFREKEKKRRDGLEPGKLEILEGPQEEKDAARFVGGRGTQWHPRGFGEVVRVH